MMPGVDSEGMDDDVPDDVNLNNHRSTNGPSSPVNGNAGKNNYVRFHITVKLVYKPYGQPPLKTGVLCSLA